MRSSTVGCEPIFFRQGDYASREKSEVGDIEVADLSDHMEVQHGFALMVIPPYDCPGPAKLPDTGSAQK
jgi:hypothetical protein